MEKKIEIIITPEEDGFGIHKAYKNLAVWEIIGILEQELLIIKRQALIEHDETKQESPKENKQ